MCSTNYSHRAIRDNPSRLLGPKGKAEAGSQENEWVGGEDELLDEAKAVDSY